MENNNSDYHHLRISNVILARLNHFKKIDGIVLCVCVYIAPRVQSYILTTFSLSSLFRQLQPERGIQDVCLHLPMEQLLKIGANWINGRLKNRWGKGITRPKTILPSIWQKTWTVFFRAFVSCLRWWEFRCQHFHYLSKRSLNFQI